MGQDMLKARLVTVKMDDSAVKEYINDISITPLAIPMICGPGAITNSIVLMQDAQSLALKGILIGSITVVLLTTFLVLRSSTLLMKLLGDTGNKILMRLMGLIMMVIAVEFFFSGLTPIIQGIFNITP